MAGDLQKFKNITNGVDGNLFERKKTLGEEGFGSNNPGLDNSGKFVGFGTN